MLVAIVTWLVVPEGREGTVGKLNVRRQISLPIDSGTRPIAASVPSLAYTSMSAPSVIVAAPPPYDRTRPPSAVRLSTTSLRSDARPFL